MSLKIYKPNAKKTGGACNWQLTSAGSSQGVYLNIVQQSGWDDKKKLGSFKDGKKTNIKFNPTEIATMLDLLESRGDEVKFFHVSEDKNTSILLKRWDMDNEVKGYGMLITQGGERYRITFELGECRLLVSWFIFALDRFHTADYTEHKKKMSQ